MIESERGSVTEELKGATHDVVREARSVGQTVRQEASGLAGTIRQGLSDQAAHQKNQIADRLSAVAERAQRTAGDLRQDEAWLGNLLGRGADELAGMADELRGQDIADLIGSVEVFARRQPALFMGAAVAMGFALARVVGADSVTSYQDDDRYRRAGPTGYGHDDNPRAGSTRVQQPDPARPTPPAAMTGSTI
jgi:hypothetical protein